MILMFQRLAGLSGYAPAGEDGGVEEGRPQPRQGAQQGVQKATTGTEKEI